MYLRFGFFISREGKELYATINYQKSHSHPVFPLPFIYLFIETAHPHSCYHSSPSQFNIVQWILILDLSLFTRLVMSSLILSPLMVMSLFVFICMRSKYFMNRITVLLSISEIYVPIEINWKDVVYEGFYPFLIQFNWHFLFYINRFILVKFVCWAWEPTQFLVTIFSGGCVMG